MDEPCSALDPIATAKVEELIHELKKQFTLVIVTHNMQQAARCSDRTPSFISQAHRIRRYPHHLHESRQPPDEAYVSAASVEATKTVNH